MRKVEEKDIPIIRALVNWSGFRLREVALEYGIGISQVQRIATKQSWSHV